MKIEVIVFTYHKFVQFVRCRNYEMVQAIPKITQNYVQHCYQFILSYIFDDSCEHDFLSEIIYNL